MNPQIQIKHSVGNTIEVPNLLDIRAVTYLSANANAGVTALSVDNAIDFSSGNILLLLSAMGGENSEIVTSSAHTNTGFTVGTTQMPHQRGDAISQIAYDQIVLKKSSTINGVYTDLITQTFQVTGQKTILFDATGDATDYYKVQWKNSITSEVSDESDPINVADYPEFSANELISSVLGAMGIDENDKNINTKFMIDSLNDARTYVKGKLYGIRHAWNQEFEYPLKLLAGTDFVTLPLTVDVSDTDQSVLAVRFKQDTILAPFNLKYVDKRTWNQISYNNTGSTLTAQVAVSGTTMVLDSTGDFYDSGTVYVATTDYDQEILEVEYTGNNKSTNTLSGVTGVTRILPVGTQVWIRPTISQPIFYTVYDGKLVFDRIIPDSIQGKNVYIDFYKKFTKIEALYDVLDEPYREIYKWYLRYAVKYRKDLSTPSDDPDLKKFEELVEALFNNLYTGQESTIITG